MFDHLRDRRAAPRLTCKVPARISDYHYDWDGVITSISSAGCFFATTEDFTQGQGVEIVILAPLAGELKFDALVAWIHPHSRGDRPRGIGAGFELKDTDRIATLDDMVENLAVENVETATRYREASRPLPYSSVLFIHRAAPSNPILNDDERAFLACVDGNASLTDIMHQMTEAEWAEISYAPFSLLGKGVVTARRALAGDPREAQRIGAPRLKRVSAGPAPTREQVKARNASAHAHYQNGVSALNDGDPRMARTYFVLAMQLAPGDAEITEALQKLDDLERH